MGGVIACGGACFAWISTIAVTCCPNRPMPETVAVSSPPVIEMDHRVPVLVQHPDDSVAVAYRPQGTNTDKKRRCCRGDLNLWNFTGDLGHDLEWISSL